MCPDPKPPDPVEEPKKRSRPDVATRIARNKQFDFTGVVVKWNTLCKDEIIQREIEQFVWNINKVALEAYHVVNLHILRCLQENLTLPTLDQNFFYRCCSGVVEKRGEHASKPDTGDVQLDATLGIFKSLRPTENYKPPTKENMAFLMCNLARQMNVACRNHLVLNFGKRLIQYVRLKYNKSRKEAWHFINQSFHPKDEKNHEHDEFSQWLGHAPYENVIDKNFTHFLRKSYDILQFMETQPANTRGARTFTIMPLKGGFVVSHITICSSCLQQILQTIVKNNPEITFLGHSNITKKVFDENKDVFWRSLFDVDSYETANRKFAYEISTNGYAVTLRMQKPKHGETLPNLPNEDDFERLIGADPGVDYLLTARTNTDEFIQISTAEYRNMAQMRKQLRWNENIKVRYPKYSQVIREMPSFSTTHIDTYLQRVGYVLTNCDELFAFCANKGFRKWRFKTYVYSKKALSTLCKRLTSGKKTCIGIGDWSRQDGIIKRHPTAPVKKIQKELRRHAKVISLDEYGTSRGCSCCGEKCLKIKLPKQNKEGVVELSRSHQIVRCSSNECAMCWQRDKNSSINHLKLLMCLLRSQERPEYMRRA